MGEHKSAVIQQFAQNQAEIVGASRFFRNDADGFHQKTKTENPLDQFSFKNAYMKPELADTDTDGDLDAYIGTNFTYPGFYAFNNNG